MSITSARAMQVLEFVDPALIEALRLLGGVILGILRQVAMRARFGDRFDDARPLFLLAPAQLFLELAEAAGRSSGPCSFLRPFLSGRRLARGAPGHRYPTAKHKKKTVRELRLPEPLPPDPLQYSKLSHVFHAKKCRCRGESGNHLSAKRSHRIVIGSYAARHRAPALRACIIGRRSLSRARMHGAHHAVQDRLARRHACSRPRPSPKRSGSMPAAYRSTPKRSPTGCSIPGASNSFPTAA